MTPQNAPGAQPHSTQASTVHPDPSPQGIPLEQAAVQPGVVRDPTASTPADAEEAQAEADAAQP